MGAASSTSAFVSCSSWPSCSRGLGRRWSWPGAASTAQRCPDRSSPPGRRSTSVPRRARSSRPCPAWPRSCETTAESISRPLTRSRPARWPTRRSARSATSESFPSPSEWPSRPRSDGRSTEVRRPGTRLPHRPTSTSRSDSCHRSVLQPDPSSATTSARSRSAPRLRSRLVTPACFSSRGLCGRRRRTLCPCSSSSRCTGLACPCAPLPSGGRRSSASSRLRSPDRATSMLHGGRSRPARRSRSEMEMTSSHRRQHRSRTVPSQGPTTGAVSGLSPWMTTSGPTRLRPGRSPSARSCSPAHSPRGS